MIKRLLLAIAFLIRSFLNGIRTVFKAFWGLTIIALIALNLTMIAIPAVYNVLAGLIWGAVSLVSEGYAANRITSATTRNAVEADARRLANLESERTRLRTERANLDLRLSSVESELADTRRRETSATRALHNLRSENSSLSTRAARAEADLELERNRLRTERTRSEAQLRSVQSELSEIRRRELAAVRAGNNLRAQNSSLIVRATLAEADLERVAARNSRMQRDAGETLTRMQQRSLRMVSRNTATVVTDALPFIGMVTIVGGVAWDVWDTCAQLDDLRSLGATFQVTIEEETEVEGRWCGLDRDEVFALIFRATPSEEKACIQARLRTGMLDPPECAAFPWSETAFSDPIHEQSQEPIYVPSMDFD